MDLSLNLRALENKLLAALRSSQMEIFVPGLLLERFGFVMWWLGVLLAVSMKPFFYMVKT